MSHPQHPRSVGTHRDPRLNPRGLITGLVIRPPPEKQSRSTSQKQSRSPSSHFFLENTLIGVVVTNMLEEFDRRGPSTCQVRLSVKILNYLTAKSNGLPIRGTPHSFTQFGFRQPMHLCTGVSEEGGMMFFITNR